MILIPESWTERPSAGPRAYNTECLNWEVIYGKEAA